MIIEVNKLEDDFKKKLIEGTDEIYQLDYGTNETKELMIKHLKDNDKIVAIKPRRN